MKKNITDDDIEKLFENNDTSIVKDIEENNNNSGEIVDQKSFLPPEMDANDSKSIKAIDRPRNYQITEETEERRKDKELLRKIKEDIENNNSTVLLQTTKVHSLDIATTVYNTINKIKNEERNRQLEKQKILSGGTKLNFDPASECTYHIYQIQQIDGNILHCGCKFCSHYKQFTLNEWDEYRYKNKKYL